jgi:Uma2 family endonuclease
VAVSTSEPLAVELPIPDEPLYEVVGGRRLELPPMGAFPTRIASRLIIRLGQFVEAHNLGRVDAEMLYRLDPLIGLERRPDVAFVSFNRWPRDRPVPEDAAWEVVPELAVEVVSPTDRAEDLMEKVEQYFEAGVLRVWVVYPRRRIVHDYETFDRLSVVPRGGELAGPPLLPGFRLDLPTLFEDQPRHPRSEVEYVEINQ